MMNPGSAPARILRHHLEDQILDEGSLPLTLQGLLN